LAARTTPPFRADHVGSLLRPRHLLQARDDRDAGRIDAAGLRAIEDEAIREVIRLQEDVGLRSATDGEYRRGTWHMDFITSLGGVSLVEGASQKITWHSPGGVMEWGPPALRVGGPLRIDDTIFGDAFAFLRDNVRTATPKLTIPSPSMVHYRGGRAAIDPAVYPDEEAFWNDLAAAYAEEIRRLAELGVTYLQLDDTSLAYVNDPEQREYVRRMGGDPDHQHERYIATINRALEGRPPGMTVTTHLCRGNYRSLWVASGGYDFVAEALFNDLRVDGYFLEFDDERSGGFEPLRFVPRGKVVVLGLVTTKRPQLERKDDLERRIEQASAHVDLDQLCLSPQCGFSSTKEGNELSADDQRRKLELVVQTAAEVWGE
jgi:5-methyltetrahydropteroyltriglutamate--homocysteine methyltransferase